VIIDVYENDIDNLNAYNLSNHFNNHADRAKAKFWRSLRQTIGIYEPTVEESNHMLESIRLGLGIVK